MSLVYLGKIKYSTCECCGELKTGDFFEWHLIMTQSILNVCLKCAKREYGKDYVINCRKNIGDV